MNCINSNDIDNKANLMNTIISSMAEYYAEKLKQIIMNNKKTN